MSVQSNEEYRRNHYVPRWYQSRFLPPEEVERALFYLDLNPDTFTDGRGQLRKKRDMERWGTRKCFREDDLYTTNFGGQLSTEIEQFFFGKIDNAGPKVLDHWEQFSHETFTTGQRELQGLMETMSIQKLRTVKGIDELKRMLNIRDHNLSLIAMQRIRDMYCAIWTDAVWVILDASAADEKFILSDHPVTLFNEECFPAGLYCKRHGDPHVAMTGTHTIFPLSLNKCLVLTNLSWVRNPYQKANREHPNQILFRRGIFDIRTVQTGRTLNGDDVARINYVVKRRARRFVAAGQKAWLFPERRFSPRSWRDVATGHFLMPDPRLVDFTTEIRIGYDQGPPENYNEYGHERGQRGFDRAARRDYEWQTFSRFQSDFAKLHGPKARGRVGDLGGRPKHEVVEALYESYIARGSSGPRRTDRRSGGRRRTRP